MQYTQCGRLREDALLHQLLHGSADEISTTEPGLALIGLIDLQRLAVAISDVDAVMQSVEQFFETGVVDVHRGDSFESAEPLSVNVVLRDGE
ncbi:hypothetical protein D3C73_675330 [compost metagenome]